MTLSVATRLLATLPSRRSYRPSAPSASKRSSQRRTVRTDTPSISAACSCVSLFAVRREYTSSNFISRTSCNTSARFIAPPFEDRIKPDRSHVTSTGHIACWRHSGAMQWTKSKPPCKLHKCLNNPGALHHVLKSGILPIILLTY